MEIYSGPLRFGFEPCFKYYPWRYILAHLDLASSLTSNIIHGDIFWPTQIWLRALLQILSMEIYSGPLRFGFEPYFKYYPWRYILAHLDLASSLTSNIIHGDIFWPTQIWLRALLQILSMEIYSGPLRFGFEPYFKYYPWRYILAHLDLASSLTSNIIHGDIFWPTQIWLRALLREISIKIKTNDI